MLVLDGFVLSGDFELIFYCDIRIFLMNLFGEKKGFLKCECKVCNVVYCFYVMILFWYNVVCNVWICDLEV